MGRLKKVKAKAADACVDGTPRANPFQGAAGVINGGSGSGSGGKGSKGSKAGSGATADRGRRLRKR
jgi:hypothetical protein